MPGDRKNRKRGGKGLRRSAQVTFGYLPKEEALQLLNVLGKAGVVGRVGYDEEVARLHSRATRINPKLRRRSSFRDVKSGYFVEISRDQLEEAKAAMATTSFKELADDRRAESGIPCANCDEPLPPGAVVCPYCDPD